MLTRARGDQDYAKSLAGKPVNALLAEAAGQRAAGGAKTADGKPAVDPAAAETYGGRAKIADGYAAQADKALRTDPIGWAEENGVVEPSPILQGGEWAQKRELAVTRAGAHYHVPIDPLRPGELDALDRRMSQAPSADDRFELAAAMILPWRDPAMAAAAIGQLEDKRIVTPAAAAVLAKARDPGQMVLARRLFGELNRPPEKITLPDVDRKAVELKAAGAYQDGGMGRVRAGAALVSGDPTHVRARDEEYQAVQQVAAVRASVGQDATGKTAYADLYGDRATLSDDGLAQVYWPRDWRPEDGTTLPPATPGLVEAGLRRLRASGADRLAEDYKPAGADAVGQRTFDRALVRRTRDEGVWVNWGDGRHFVLIVPGTGRPVANPDQTPWVVSLDQVMGASLGATPAFTVPVMQ